METIFPPHMSFLRGSFIEIGESDDINDQDPNTGN